MKLVAPKPRLAGFGEVTTKQVVSVSNGCVAAACCVIDGGVKLDKISIGSGVLPAPVIGAAGYASLVLPSSSPANAMLSFD
ncbi:hypothetical protein GGD41_006183 [Paraburkholderia bryophila]|uniref:Uncharacterized protein n=1 Tax=Paraburkholderia bryophila TaxID=420952 RepID=A0A7Y9WDP3_9BURK|nr:hypothetical protein [Paraburkholderia bryophila]